jgi:alanine racemase
MAIIKADAYGHGALMCLPTLLGSGVDQLGVASLDEAFQIRQSGFTDVPILVVGPAPPWALAEAVANHIAIAVYQQEQLTALQELLTKHPPTQPYAIHIKVDTGMNRLGVPWQQATEFIQQAQGIAGLNVLGVFSHLACGNDVAFSTLQAQRFADVVNALPIKPRWIHLANTPGSLAIPPAQWESLGLHTNMVRLGLSLWGYTGLEPSDTLPNLKPVMALRARVVQLHTVPAHEGISYGQHLVSKADKARLIATLPLGYADGVPRGLSNRMQASVRNTVVSQVGTITMDQLMVDVTHVPHVQVGDTVTLLGTDVAAHCDAVTTGAAPVATLSDWTNTLSQANHTPIEYELMCALRVRLPRLYSR